MGLGTFTFADLDHILDRQGIAAALGWAPAKVVFVHGTKGSSGNDGLARGQPKATLAQALALCDATSGHVVYVMAGHTETLSTASVTLATAGVTILGEGSGRSRPALTCGAANVSGLILTGANTLLQNIRFIGDVAQTGLAVGLLDIQATDTVVRKCVFEHGGAGPLQAVSLVSAHRTVFEDCYWLGTAAGPDMGVKTTGAVCNDVRFSRCIFNYGSVNVDSAAIGGLANGGYPGLIVEDTIILGANSTAIRNLGSYAATVPDGVLKQVYMVSSTGITLGSTLPIDPGGCAIMDCYWTDAVAAAGLWLASQQVATASNVSKAPILSPGPT